jgi:hypothetical protein
MSEVEFNILLIKAFEKRNFGDDFDIFNMYFATNVMLFAGGFIVRHTSPSFQWVIFDICSMKMRSYLLKIF